MPAVFVPFPHDYSVRTREAFNRGYDDAMRGDLSASWCVATRRPRKTATLLAYMAGLDAGRSHSTSTPALPVHP